MANVLPFKTRCDIAAHLCDGSSLSATERLVKVTRKTIGHFAVALGEGCARLHDRLVRNVMTTDIEMDEIWSFVFKKQHRLAPNDPSEWGDNYTFVGMARSSKLVISYLTGPRDGVSTFVFVYDLKQRVATVPWRVQYSSDGFAPYIPAMRAAFGLRVDYGQVVKQYGHKQRDDHRYEPPRDADFIRKTAILGVPRFERMSTSGVERQNLTMRMHIRRLTRLTNAFSKKRRNLGAAIALHFMWYNFVRCHEALKVPPAYAAGITDHVWDIEELVERALAEPEPTPSPLAPIPSRDGWRPMQQVGLFDAVGGLPAVIGNLLPPGVGGPSVANDGAGPSAPSLSELGAAAEVPKLGAAPPAEEEEGPATERDPAPYGAAAPTMGGGSFESGT